jgi:restriction system protein
MPVPDFQTVMLPFLKTLAKGEEWLMRDVTEHLATAFKLSPEERQEMLPSGAMTLINNRVAWAKTHLKNAGLLENPKRGVVKLSARGKSVLAENPQRLIASSSSSFQATLSSLANRKELPLLSPNPLSSKQAKPRKNFLIPHLQPSRRQPPKTFWDV